MNETRSMWTKVKDFLNGDRGAETQSSDEEEKKQETERLLKKLADQGTPLPLPETELHQSSRLALDIPHPHVTKFVREARKVGLADEEIAEELGKAGWDRQEISRALNV